MFILHGYPKLMGGPDKWESLGGNMDNIGINFAPVFWGFMAAFAEAIGGLMLLLGFLTRPACVLLFITMVVAAVKHNVDDGTFMSGSHATESAIVFLSLIFIGPGKYSLDAWLLPPRVKKVAM
jgi:putative oxidoreductase